jgi:GTP-binding protein
MPGYGYARAPKSAVEAWTKLVFSYLRGRANLRRVYLLIDGRHGLKDNDIETIKLIDQAAVSYQIVLTKTDKLKKAELDKVIRETAEGIAKRAAAHPVILATSAETGEGIAALRAEIAALV